MSPGDVIIFVDDHQLTAATPFLGTVVFLFPFCFVFLILSSECLLRLLYVHRPIFSVQWSSRVFLRTLFYCLSFLIRKTSACCWLLRHPSVSPLCRLTVNCFFRTILDYSLLLVWVQLYFPNKCIIQVHPWWRLPVIISVVLPWTSVFAYLLAKR